MPGPSAPPPKSNRGPILALVTVAVLVVVLYATAQAILHHNALQNCIDSGRRDCQSLTQP